MSSLSRRAVLRFGGATFASGVAGCSSLTSWSGPDPPKIVDFRAMNFDDEPHTVRVHLRRDGKPVYRESLRLKASDPDDPSEGEFEGYPTEAGADVIRVWRDDQPKDRRRELDFGDYGSDCVGFLIEIGGVIERNSRVSIWKTANCNPPGE